MDALRLQAALLSMQRAHAAVRELVFAAAMAAVALVSLAVILGVTP